MQVKEVHCSWHMLTLYNLDGERNVQPLAAEGHGLNMCIARKSKPQQDRERQLAVQFFAALAQRMEKAPHHCLLNARLRLRQSLVDGRCYIEACYVDARPAPTRKEQLELFGAENWQMHIYACTVQQYLAVQLFLARGSDNQSVVIDGY